MQGAWEWTTQDEFRKYPRLCCLVKKLIESVVSHVSNTFVPNQSKFWKLCYRYYMPITLFSAGSSSMVSGKQLSLFKSTKQIKWDRWSEWLSELLMPQTRSIAIRHLLTKLSKCNNRHSQYSLAEKWPLCLSNGNLISLYGLFRVNRSMAVLVRATRRNLGPCKSAAVWATWGTQGEIPSPSSPLKVWFKSGGHCRREEETREETGLFFISLYQEFDS